MAGGDNYLDGCKLSLYSCQTGTKVSGTGNSDRCGTGLHATRVCIDYYGDYVYVYDGDSDGHSALAEIYTDAGNVNLRYCRNPHGYGTWAKCNFNWTEKTSQKEVYGGYRVSYTNYQATFLWAWS